MPRDASSPERIITALFGYRNHLLKMAAITLIRERIFTNRERIAATFRQFGGERHEDTARLFESLGTPDDLIQHAIFHRDKKEERRAEQRDHKPGYYVCPRFIDDEEEGAIKKRFRPGFNPGRQMRLSLKGLLYAKAGDSRPIYITETISERLFEALRLIVSLKPFLAKRIEFMEPCANGDFKFAPYGEMAARLEADFPLVIQNASGQKAAMRKLSEFLFEAPMEGQVYRGVVTKVFDAGAFVTIKMDETGVLPVEGLLKIEDISESHEADPIGVGDEVVVEVVSFDRVSKRMMLSEKKANESLSRGATVISDFADRIPMLPE
ncbi:MAG: S1 RNA-binding domain-containing protein [Candidatus Gracilibacteria bacterium]